MLEKQAEKVIEILENGGYEAYFVGGCVRDRLMGRTPKDFDITTNADSDTVIKLMNGHSLGAYLKGGSCGTVGIRGIDEIEITPYRTESGYADHRHPSNVVFVKDLGQDLSRRDFTINAMAKKRLCDDTETVDLFGGREDLDMGVIRCVGDARTRFEEDALRILRALRFAARYGFCVEENTKKAIFETRELLDFISDERIMSELEKILVSSHSEEVVAAFLPIFEDIMINISERGLDLVERDFEKRFFFLARGLEYAEFCKMVRFHKLSSKQKETIIRYKEIHDMIGENFCDKRLLGRAVACYGYHVREYLCVFGKRELFCDIFDDPSIPKNISELDVSGDDLSRLGICGRMIGETLAELLQDAIEGNVKNQKDELLRHVQGKIKD